MKPPINKAMKKLTSRKFKNYAETLQITAEIGQATANDGNEDICVMNPENGTEWVIESIHIDDVEYTLTDKQILYLKDLTSGSIEYSREQHNSFIDDCENYGEVGF